MDDPQQILRRARRGAVPSTWTVFTGKRGAVRSFFTRTSGDPLVVVKWQAPSVDDELRVVQSVIEAYGAHRARDRRGTT